MGVRVEIKGAPSVKALIVLDCQKGMLARGDFDLLKENILKLQEMFKASGNLIIHTHHIDENEESCPINILNRGAEEPQWNNAIRVRKPEITEQLNIETIYEMLERVNTMILKSSMKIEELIKQQI